MDAVRVAKSGPASHVDLFPAISVGDAPVAARTPAKSGKAP
jgi:hypothetical protein